MTDPSMTVDALIEGLPDLVVLVRRDGVVLQCGGGHGVPDLRPSRDCTGQRLEAVWSRPVAALLKQLTRRAIAVRATTEARFEDGGCAYEARASAHGPERAICVVRAATAGTHDDALESSDERPRLQLDRRGFLRRFKESMSLAALREMPLAVAVIHVDGIADIAQIIATKVSEQIMSVAILRLPTQSSDSGGGKPWWYLGQLSESLLAVVLESSDRDAIGACLASVCASLREPVAAAGAEFHLTPYAGIAVLGQDASSPKLLLDHARAAATEARRSGSSELCFFTDTLRLRSLARLDIARELRDAITNRDIRLRYVGRHDLASGRLVAWVGYLHWQHPLRGEIRPAEFLRVAETTGLATTLSRAVLAGLREDFAVRAAQADADVRLSFGALRHHVLHEDFAADIGRFLAEGGVPAGRLELRISEHALIARDAVNLECLGQLGVQLVVDEVGRGMGSLDLLARAPIWGLQLDRAWVTALRSDAVARKVCRAGIGVAAALGLTPIATGVDDPQQRDALLALGCRLGSGDLFRSAAADITTAPRTAARA
jgi:EAL domain-containing protein (putative c-di-GMP-specific phosphodiesterase class I)/GGDEF domain-containing protein